MKLDDERINKIEQEIIYEKKALNNGFFNNGKYYDFYWKKEAIVAEIYIKEQLKDVIEKTSIIEVENDLRTLYRLTVIFKKD